MFLNLPKPICLGTVNLWNINDNGGFILSCNFFVFRHPSGRCLDWFIRKFILRLGHLLTACSQETTHIRVTIFKGYISVHCHLECLAFRCWVRGIHQSSANRGWCRRCIAWLISLMGQWLPSQSHSPRKQDSATPIRSPSTPWSNPCTHWDPQDDMIFGQWVCWQVSPFLFFWRRWMKW